MKRKSPPNWSLILCLYAVAAIFLVVVRDELGTDQDPQMKAGGWIALTFAVYWSFRGLFAWLREGRLINEEGRVKSEE